MSSLVSEVEILARSQAPNGRRICIVTSAPICCNPRVVKEADTLSAAGYSVRVVASQQVEWTIEWDRQLMTKRAWKLESVRWHHGSLRLRSAVRQRAFATLANFTTQSLVPERAYSRIFDEQLRLAKKARADLFIAHNPQALPIAAAAARHFGTQFAFDSEDLHSGEFGSSGEPSRRYRLLNYLETEYLPRCAFVTAPSEQISETLATRYRIRKPKTIHNVFSWDDRSKLDGQIKDRCGPTLSVYWYSQIVGLDRGLQDVIRAAALLTEPVQIHIRGDLTHEVRQALNHLATSYGVADSLIFHPIVHPDQLLSRASEHDVGLALEPPNTENRNLTAANKIFHYFLAGLSIAASATDGQRGVMKDASSAGFLYRSGDHKTLAAEMQRLIDSPSLLASRKRSALEAARIRWNWERESQKLLDVVSSALTDHEV